MSKPAMQDDRAMLQAMIESAAMDETLDYLRRGRAHGDMTDEALRDEWARAFKHWFAWRSRSGRRQTDDLSAELRLRKIDAPFERIATESGTMAEEIRYQGADSEDIREKIEKFRRDLRRRKN